MIKGYEDVYGINGGEKIYNIPSKLAHGEYQPVAESATAIDVSPMKIYANMIEQEVGQQNYKKLLGVQRALNDAVKALKVYQHDEALFKSTSEALKDIENRRTELISNIQTVSKNVGSLSSEDLTNLQAMIGELDAVNIQRESIKQDLKPVTKDELTFAFNDLKQKYLECEDALPEINSKLNKFNNPEFKEKLEQCYVDSILLPGQEKREQNVRKDANAKYEMFNIEQMGLKRGVENARGLLDFVSKNGASSPIPEELNNNIEIQNALETIAGTDPTIWGSLDGYQTDFLTSGAVSDFYSFVAKNVEESLEKGKDLEDPNKIRKAGIVQYKIANTFELGGQYSGTIGLVAHAVKNATGKVKSPYGFVIDDFRPTFDGLFKLEKAQYELKNNAGREK